MMEVDYDNLRVNILYEIIFISFNIPNKPSMKQLALLVILSFIFFDGMSQSEPSKVSAFINEGIKLHDQKKYDEAIAIYKEALKLEPDNASANYEIAFSFMGIGQTNEAIPYLEKVTKTKNRVTVSAYDLLGSIYDNMDQKDKAIEFFKKGIQADPTYQRIYYNTAITYLRMGKEKEAIPYLLQALNRDPNHASGHNLYASLMAKNPETKIDAILAYCNFLILEPTSARSATSFIELKKLLGSGVAKSDKGNEITLSNGTDVDRNAANLAISLSDVASLIPGLSENEKLGQQLKSIFSIVGELAEKKASKDFFWTYYADYFGKIGKSEYMPMVAHIIGFTANQEENRKWITANDAQLQDFNKWRIAIPRKVSM